jgi:hypothetical protein
LKLKREPTNSASFVRWHHAARNAGQFVNRKQTAIRGNVIKRESAKNARIVEAVPNHWLLLPEVDEY